MRLSLTSGPGTEPISRAEAKLHLKIETGVTADDSYVDALIVAARMAAERRTDRQLITATWKGKCDRFPCSNLDDIVIPKAPLLTVTQVQYVDPTGATVVWANTEYVVDAPAGPYCLDGRIYAGFNKYYPTTAVIKDAVIITFTAGYGPAASDVPQPIKEAMYLLIGHWYENRETVVVGETQEELPWAAEVLLAQFQRWSTVLL